MTRRALPRAAFLLSWLPALAAAGAVRAETRIAVAPIDGARPALVRQIKADVCGTFRCVPFSRIAAGKGFDLGKVRREALDGVLAGAVSEPRGVPVLSLSLYTTAHFADLTWRVRLDERGAMPRSRLAALLREIEGRIGEPPPAPPPRPQPPPVPQPGQGAAGLSQEPQAGRPGPPAVRPVPLPPPPARTALVARPEPRPAPPWLSVEVGGLGGRRELRLSDALAGPAPLRGHLVPRFAGPAARLELYPAAPFGEGFLAGLGLYGAYATSLLLETRADGADRSTRLWRLSAGALWRSAPPGRPRFAVLATASWEARGATVRPAVLGLADTALSGLRGGLGIEFPIAGPVFGAVGGGYTHWLRARDLVGGVYFPEGTAFGVDGEAGVGLAIWDWIQLRLAGEYATTRYSFRPHPEDVYRASGAIDDQYAGRLTVRLSL